MSGYNILIDRGVTRLCHLTLLKSLTHIITSPSGIVATNIISQDIKTVNDEERLDGKLNYVCTSVQYPNSWYLVKADNRNMDKIFREWVVIYIDPSVLNERKSAFCPCNASKNNGAFIDDNIDNIGSIFEYRVPEWRYSRPLNMLPCCPTNGQAEILIKDNIPNRFIIGIAVENKDVAERVYSMLKIYSKDIPIYIAPEVLNTEWSCKARNGERPAEIRYDGLVEG